MKPLIVGEAPGKNGAYTMRVFGAFVASFWLWYLLWSMIMRKQQMHQILSSYMRHSCLELRRRLAASLRLTTRWATLTLETQRLVAEPADQLLHSSCAFLT